jgi:phage major head subunit gpT-like protein
MGPLTPSWVTDLETNMRILQEDSYAALQSELWYNAVAKVMPSSSKTERLVWLLDTAQIKYTNRLGGDVEFQNILSQTTEFTVNAAEAGLELNRFQLEDHDGGGVQLATQWSRQIGAQAAYWPQKQVAGAIRLGGAATSLAYDSEIFFSTAHPLNPYNTGLGNYANDFTGAASGIYPGAVDISSAVSVSAAVDNLHGAFAYMRSILQANGADPRGLRPAFIMVPPALAARAQQITNAKYIAQDAVASGAGGSGDIEAIVRNWGIGQPIVCDELASNQGTGGSDTTFYIAAKQVGTTELGSITYVDREPFSVIFNGQMTDAQLARANKLQWIVRGRNIVGYGHPYLLFRCQAS